MEQILSEQIFAEMIRRVVEVAYPQWLILFGSATRGDMGPHSDVDLLVIVDQPVHRRRLAQAIYRNLVGVGFAADIVVVITQDLERDKDNRYTVICPAQEEGQVIYAA